MCAKSDLLLQFIFVNSVCCHLDNPRVVEHITEESGEKQ